MIRQGWLTKFHLQEEEEQEEDVIREDGKERTQKL